MANAIMFVREIALLSLYKDESTDAESALLAFNYIVLRARHMMMD